LKEKGLTADGCKKGEVPFLPEGGINGDKNVEKEGGSRGEAQLGPPPKAT